MRRNVIFIIAGVIFTLALYIIVQLYSPLEVKDKTLEIQIPSGATFRQAIELFSKEGIIQNKNLIILLKKNFSMSLNLLCKGIVMASP